MVQIPDSETEFVQELVRKIIPVAEKKQDTFTLVRAYNKLGNTYRTYGQQDSAILAFRTGATLANAVGNHSAEYTSTSNIGQVLSAQGQFEEARHAYRSAQNINNQVLDDTLRLTNEMWLQSFYGDLYQSMGIYDSALLSYVEITKREFLLGDTTFLAETYNTMGSIFSGYLERYDTAIKYYHKALAYYSTQNNRLGICKRPQSSLI